MDGSLTFLGCVVFGGLVSIAMQLHRIAKALEEKNKVRSRQTTT
jgi:uncharacterized integral membrane protein